MKAAAQCEICGHIWTWTCASEAQARERLERTTVCPGRRCHTFPGNALDHCIFDVIPTEVKESKE